MNAVPSTPLFAFQVWKAYPLDALVKLSLFIIVLPLVTVEDDVCLTVTVAVAFMEVLAVLVAVIVAVPAAFAVILPLDTVATEESDVDQVALADALLGVGVTVRL